MQELQLRNINLYIKRCLCVQPRLLTSAADSTPPVTMAPHGFHSSLRCHSRCKLVPSGCAPPLRRSTPTMTLTPSARPSSLSHCFPGPCTPPTSICAPNCVSAPPTVSASSRSPAGCPPPSSSESQTAARTNATCGYSSHVA